MTPKLARARVGELPAGVALYAAIGFIQPMRACLGRQQRAVLELELAHEARCLVEDVAARHVDIARDGTQRCDDTMQRRGIGTNLVDTASREQTCRLARRIHASCRTYILGTHLRDGGCLVYRALECSGLELVETRAPLFDKLVIVEVFLDDDTGKRVGEDEISTREGSEPQCRLGRRHGKPRIDDDELAIVANVIGDVAPEERIVRLGRIGAPKHEAFREVGSEVALDRPTVGHRVHPDTGVPANGADAHVVGAVDETHEAMKWPVDRMRPPDGARHRPRPVGVDEQAQARRDIVKRLVPAHANKPTAATWPYAFQGIVDAGAFVVELLEVERPAATACRHARVIRIARGIRREIDNTPSSIVASKAHRYPQ